MSAVNFQDKHSYISTCNMFHRLPYHVPCYESYQEEHLS